MNLANMKRSETTEQIGLINWARANEEYVPELRLLHHIPNEGIRTNGPVLKAAGMKAGVPDLSLPVPRRGFHGLYIEMKFGKGKTTKAQEEFMALLREQGYKNGGGIRSRTGPRSDPALSGTRGRVRSGELRTRFQNVRILRRRGRGLGAV